MAGQKKLENMAHHALVIEASQERGIELAREWVETELGLVTVGNPDVVVLTYGLLTVSDARKVGEKVSSAPFVGECKAVILAADRLYHEAQNALLKLFEEPPIGTYLLLVVPTLGSLLPTLLSRVEILSPNERPRRSFIQGEGAAEEFMKATKEKRSALIKKLTSGKDEEDRREKREEAIALLSAIEARVYAATREGQTLARYQALLTDIAVLRAHLYERSAPVKMILEHLSLVLPRELE